VSLSECRHQIENHTLASDHVLVPDFQRNAMAGDDQRITANLVDCGKRGEERSRFAQVSFNGASVFGKPAWVGDSRICKPFRASPVACHGPHETIELVRQRS
jgi:hypothetical protein